MTLSMTHDTRELEELRQILEVWIGTIGPTVGNNEVRWHVHASLEFIGDNTKTKEEKEKV